MSTLEPNDETKYSILDDLVIPDNIQQSWQKTVDLMADLVGTPAGLIMRVHDKEIEVLVASSNEDNVYEPNEKAKLDTGLYCETVMSTREPLHVPNALADPLWKDNPDVDLNMISYLGVPLIWPTNEIFGTICILDSKPNQYSDRYRALLTEFQQSVQLSLKTIWENSQLVKMQKQLIKAKDKAETANKAKSLFLSNMSHELRTPLNAVLGFSRMLQREPNLSDSAKEDLGAIAFSGEHLLSLINDVLDMSKIEANRIEVDADELDLRQTIKDISHLMRAKCLDKNLNFNLELNDNVPNYIRGDKIKIRQILINLISNAAKYTQTGSVVFRSWSEADSHLGQRLLFEVQDTGVGISEQDQAGVFEPFRQLDNRPVETEGTGLGLAITSKFVTLMGGEIGVESELGRGSTFTVSLPLQLADGLDLQKNSSSSSIVIGLMSQSNAPKILIAEDQLHNRNLLNKILTSCGFLVEVAIDGEQAISKAKSFQPDFIWMDIRMPKVNGIEACLQIIANSGAEPPVIVALTTSLQEGEHLLALEAGCKRVLYKPYQEHDIFSIMAEHLNLQYRYDDEIDDGGAQQESLTLEQVVEKLRSIDADKISAIKLGAEELDIEKTLALIEQIDDKALADNLTNLVNNFDFEALMSLLDSSGSA